MCIYIELGIFHSVYVYMHLRRWVWRVPSDPLAERDLPCRGGPRRSYTHILCVHVYIYSIAYIPFTLHICTCGGGGCGGNRGLFGLQEEASSFRGGPRHSYIHILLLHVHMYIYRIGYVLFCVCMYAPAAVGLVGTSDCSD